MKLGVNSWLPAEGCLLEERRNDYSNLQGVQSLQRSEWDQRRRSAIRLAAQAFLCPVWLSQQGHQKRLHVCTSPVCRRLAGNVNKPGWAYIFMSDVPVGWPETSAWLLINLGGRDFVKRLRRARRRRVHLRSQTRDYVTRKGQGSRPLLKCWNHFWPVQSGFTWALLFP